MISYNVYRSTASGAYVEGFALDTDDLPIVGISNGSKMEVLDPDTGVITSKVYDQEGGEWVAYSVSSGGGGGGGGGGSSGGGVFVVNMTQIDDAITANKTFDEVIAAVKSGEYVVARVEEGDVAEEDRDYEFYPIREAGQTTITFTNTLASPMEVRTVTIMWSNEDGIELFSVSYPGSTSP